MPRQRNTSFSNKVEAAIAAASQQTGINPQTLRAFARIESSGNPNAVTGSYRGLFQLSTAEFAKHGSGDIMNPNDNALAAARKFQAEGSQFQQQFGRAPSSAELYLMHQQGVAGAAAHRANPDAPAWQNMAATAEGRQKGDRWAKAAIWGNIPNADKQKFGSVDNVTSRAFTGLWDGRIGQLAGDASPAAIAAAAPTLADPRFRTQAETQSFTQVGADPFDQFAGATAGGTLLPGQAPAEIPAPGRLPQFADPSVAPDAPGLGVGRFAAPGVTPSGPNAGRFAAPGLAERSQSFGFQGLPGPRPTTGLIPGPNGTVEPIVPFAEQTEGFGSPPPAGSAGLAQQPQVAFPEGTGPVTSAQPGQAVPPVPISPSGAGGVDAITNSDLPGVSDRALRSHQPPPGWPAWAIKAFNAEATFPERSFGPGTDLSPPGPIPSTNDFLSGTLGSIFPGGFSSSGGFGAFGGFGGLSF